MGAAKGPTRRRSGARRATGASAAEWNPRKTGIHVTPHVDEIQLVLSEELRTALDDWKARRDARWPEVPRTPEWLFVTKSMTEHLHRALTRFAPHVILMESEQIDAFLRRYDLDPLRAFARAQAAAAAPPPPDDGGLTIVSAFYGKGRRKVDVAQALASRIVGGRLFVHASNELGGDPAYGVVKKLTVRYVWRGRRHVRSVAEHDGLALP